MTRRFRPRRYAWVRVYRFRFERGTRHYAAFGHARTSWRQYARRIRRAVDLFRRAELTGPPYLPKISRRVIDAFRANTRHTRARLLFIKCIYCRRTEYVSIIRESVRLITPPPPNLPLCVRPVAI